LLVFWEHEIILVKIETEKGIPTMKSKKAKFYDFTANVVFLTLGKYRSYLEQGIGEKLSTRHANALREGVRQGLLKPENAEKIYAGFEVGKTAEVVASEFYYSHTFTRGVRRAKGLAAFYKKAAMLSAAAYAASPESEAYWAS
jgi:hypothetical protein